MACCVKIFSTYSNLRKWQWKVRHDFPCAINFSIILDSCTYIYKPDRDHQSGFTCLPHSTSEEWNLPLFISPAAICRKDCLYVNIKQQNEHTAYRLFCFRQKKKSVPPTFSTVLRSRSTTGPHLSRPGQRWTWTEMSTRNCTALRLQYVSRRIVCWFFRQFASTGNAN